MGGDGKKLKFKSYRLKFLNKESSEKAKKWMDSEIDKYNNEISEKHKRAYRLNVDWINYTKADNNFEFMYRENTSWGGTVVFFRKDRMPDYDVLHKYKTRIQLETGTIIDETRNWIKIIPKEKIEPESHLYEYDMLGGSDEGLFE